MKVIDVNVMLGPWLTPMRYRTVSGLMNYLDDYRITSAVTYHSAAQMTPWRYNGEMSDIAGDSGGRIQACHVLDPALGEKNEPGEGTLKERLRAIRPAAVRMMPASQSFPLNGFFCGQILSILDELRIPLLLDKAEAPPLADIPQLASEFPNMPVVLLRCTFNRARYYMPLLEKLKNVYVDTGILVDTGALEELVNERRASEKLLMGSGLPHHVPAGGLSIVLYSPIDDAHKENILYRNWERLQGGIRYDNQG